MVQAPVLLTDALQLGLRVELVGAEEDPAPIAADIEGAVLRRIAFGHRELDLGSLDRGAAGRVVRSALEAVPAVGLGDRPDEPARCSGRERRPSPPTEAREAGST